MIIVGSASAAGTSVAIPAHQVGDLILVFARRASNTPATIPTATTVVPTWVTAQSAGANTLALTTVSAVATRTDHQTGVFTSASHVAVLVLRADSGKVISIRTSTVGNGNNATTLIYPAVTLGALDGTSHGVRVGTRGVAATGVGTSPSGWTAQQVQPAGASALMSVHTRLGLVANPTADSITGLASSAYRAHTVEITEIVPPNPVTEDAYDDFSRADGLVYAGAGATLWTVERLDWDQPTLMQVKSNALANPGASYEQAVSKGILGAAGDFDLVMDCTVTGAAPNEIAIWFCVTNHGPIAAVDGYAFIGSSAGNYWAIRKYVDGVNAGTLVGPDTTKGPIVAGNSIWIAKRGTTFTIYRKPSGGIYSKMIELIDASYSSGVFAIETSDATIRWDNIRGGPWTGLGPPPTAKVVSIT